MESVYDEPISTSVHGANPQKLIEKILRTRIYANSYWKERCYNLTAETLLDLAMEMQHFGGTFGGNRKPTKFLILTMKLLQLQPDKEIIIEFIKNEDHRYVRLLGAFYLRLVGKPVDIYRYLEPLYNDYRTVNFKTVEGSLMKTHVDEVMEKLLSEESYCDIILPRLPKRFTLEEAGVLEKRVSALDEDLLEDEIKQKEKEEKKLKKKQSMKRSKSRSTSRSPKRHSRRSRSRSPKRHHRRHRDRSRSRSPKRHSRRSRSRSPKRSSRRDRSRSPRKEKHRSKKSSNADDDSMDEIAQMNKLRASLGLGPLKE